jgi:DNA-binding response OmpR family regulator
MAQTVLLIDYDPGSVGRIRRLLREAGFAVLLARGGREGVREFHRSRPDLTLVQDLLPGLHGFDVCRQIKNTDEGKDSPVVILSVPGKHAALVRTGCDAYIEKPFGDDELLDVIRHLLPERIEHSRGVA